MSTALASAEIVSVQVGRAAPLPWRGATVPSGIVKRPVSGRIALAADGLAGDEQADLSVHGGPDKAVYAYPQEHMPGWEELLGKALGPGAVGENLSLRGLLEDDVRIGDVFTAGTATLQVSQPRGPCFKFAALHDRRELPAVMARQGNAGWYFRVLQTGAIGAGDALALVARGSEVTVAEVLRVTYRDRRDGTTGSAGGDAAIARVMAVPELAPQWRAQLEHLARRRMLPLGEFGT